MKKVNTFYVSFLILSILFLSLFLANYNPTDVGPTGILLFFILLYFASTATFGILILIFSFVSNSIYNKLSKRNNNPVREKLIILYSILLGTVPVFFIALNSVGGVGFFEIITIFIFEFLGVFYIRKKVS